MTIRIVTDSTCDLPAEIIERYGITVVPLYINIGGKSYLDGVELSREEFYARLPDCQSAPTTAVPGPQRFTEVYRQLADEGATTILSIHINSSLSAVVNSARLGAEALPSLPIAVIDAGSLTLGMGFLAWNAAEAAAEGRSVEQILALIRDQDTRTYVFAALDTLEFLRRSGRLNPVLATLGSWLQMKPLLKMNNGHAAAEKVLTLENAIQRLIALVSEVAPLEKVALVHTHAVERAEEIRRRAQHLLPPGDLLSVDITPVFGSHLGPRAAGFACVAARPL